MTSDIVIDWRHLKKYRNDTLLQLALQISLVLIREHALESPEAGYELLYGCKMI